MNDFYRALMHFPVGLFASWLIYVNSALGVVFALGFLFYEAIEDWRIKDRSYKDVSGFLFGLGLGAFIIYLLGVLCYLPRAL